MFWSIFDGSILAIISKLQQMKPLKNVKNKVWHGNENLCSGILLSHKKEIFSFVTALMDLESIMLSQSKKDKYDYINMQNIMNKMETELWIPSTDLQLSEGRGGAGWKSEGIKEKKKTPRHR